jgi:hypothetical protein
LFFFLIFSIFFCDFFIRLSYFNTSFEFSLNLLLNLCDLNHNTCGKYRNYIQIMDRVNHLISVIIWWYLAIACLNLRSTEKWEKCYALKILS